MFIIHFFLPLEVFMSVFEKKAGTRLNTPLVAVAPHGSSMRQTAPGGGGTAGCEIPDEALIGGSGSEVHPLSGRETGAGPKQPTAPPSPLGACLGSACH